MDHSKTHEKAHHPGAAAFPLTHEKNGIYVGETSDGLSLHLPDDIRTGHVQILGATGRGKTESIIIAWIARDLDEGRSVLLIDGKGDPELADKIEEATRFLKQPVDLVLFDLGNPKTSCTTNPLANGTAQQITDRIFTAFEFEDPYYKSVQYDVCGSIISLIQAEPKQCQGRADHPAEVNFERLYRYLTDDKFLSELLMARKAPTLERKLTDFLNLPREVKEKRLSGLLSQIAPFATGEVAPLVNGKVEGRAYATISELVLEDGKPNTKQRALIFLVPTLKYQQLGHQLGKLLLQELGWAVGERASRRGKTAPLTPVYLDEFSAFVYPGFTNILNKARSSRLPLHLSHQSLADLSMVSPEFAQVITTNTNVKCIFGLNDPESADFMARHMGTVTQEKLTEQAERGGWIDPKKKTGAMSIREVEAYKIHPNALKEYVNGRGVIHFPSERGNVTEEIQFERLSLKSKKQGGANG